MIKAHQTKPNEKQNQMKSKQPFKITMPITMPITMLILCFLLAANSVNASDKPHHASPYAGEQQRQIKSLSPDDIHEIARGGGWGFAKPAELNGVPGPAHVLELQDKLSLNSDQVIAVEMLHKAMLLQAIPLGKQYIDGEKTLNQMFASKQYNHGDILLQIKKIENIRAQLRYAHLSKHLETAEILSSKQISLYNKLRGYTSGNVCDNIPIGHDVEMFKKHNHCE